MGQGPNVISAVELTRCTLEASLAEHYWQITWTFHFEAGMKPCELPYVLTTKVLWLRIYTYMYLDILIQEGGE